VVIVFDIGPNVLGLRPGRGRYIFRDDKNPFQDFFRRASKVVGPML
jgi:hypothetical protein